VVVEMTKGIIELLPLIENVANGLVVPIPTLPLPRTLKRVAFVELATAKSEVVGTDDGAVTDK
jgi:hypothetical protein